MGLISIEADVRIGRKAKRCRSIQKLRYEVKFRFPRCRLRHLGPSGFWALFVLTLCVNKIKELWMWICQLTTTRVRIKHRGRGHNIDFRHLIGNLRRKPQALRYLVYREALFPSHAYLRAWQAFDAKLEARKACRDMVALLDIAARGNCVDALALRIDAALDSDRLPDIGKLTAEFLPISRAQQDVTIPPPDHAAYNRLLASEQVHA